MLILLVALVGVMVIFVTREVFPVVGVTNALANPPGVNTEDVLKTKISF